MGRDGHDLPRDAEAVQGTRTWSASAPPPGDVVTSSQLCPQGSGAQGWDPPRPSCSRCSALATSPFQSRGLQGPIPLAESPERCLAGGRATSPASRSQPVLQPNPPHYEPAPRPRPGDPSVAPAETPEYRESPSRSGPAPERT